VEVEDLHILASLRGRAEPKAKIVCMVLFDYSGSMGWGEDTASI
jgi:hypothetical protein